MDILAYDSVAQWICHVKLTLLHITIDYQTVILYWITPLPHSFSFDISRKLHVFVIKNDIKNKDFLWWRKRVKTGRKYRREIGDKSNSCYTKLYLEYCVWATYIYIPSILLHLHTTICGFKILDGKDIYLSICTVGTTICIP